MENEYSYQDWLKCPKCGSEDASARDYYTELIFECSDCGEQHVMIHGMQRPLSHADPDQIKERLKNIQQGDEEAQKTRWGHCDTEQ